MQHEEPEMYTEIGDWPQEIFQMFKTKRIETFYLMLLFARQITKKCDGDEKYENKMDENEMVRCVSEAISPECVMVCRICLI